MKMQILYLPCGCVVDGDHPATMVDDVPYLECRWCGATIDCQDLDIWIGQVMFGEILMPFAHNRARKVFSLNGRFIVELYGECGCGAPYVRESRKHQPELIHLRPGDVLEQLSN